MEDVSTIVRPVVVAIIFVTVANPGIVIIALLLSIRPAAGGFVNRVARHLPNCSLNLPPAALTEQVIARIGGQQIEPLLLEFSKGSLLSRQQPGEGLS